jgi:hypothetical protein
MTFELIGKIQSLEIIAVGRQIHYPPKLRKKYGTGRWRKLKGIGGVRLPDGYECEAELHWYEAHGIGKKEMKIKRLLD